MLFEQSRIIDLSLSWISGLTYSTLYFQMAVSHPHLLNFIEKNELVTFTSGKYEEVSAVVDDFDTIFKFKKNEWSSIPLESKQTSVNGFKQSFAWIYDTEPDVFAFVTIEEEKTV